MIALIEQEAPKGLSRAAMCRALSVNRAALYRARRPPAPRDDVALRDAIQRIALELPGYGSRRITAELRRRAWRINRNACSASCERTTCCACGALNECARPIRAMR